MNRIDVVGQILFLIAVACIEYTLPKRGGGGGRGGGGSRGGSRSRSSGGGGGGARRSASGRPIPSSSRGTNFITGAATGYMIAGSSRRYYYNRHYTGAHKDFSEDRWCYTTVDVAKLENHVETALFGNISHSNATLLNSTKSSLAGVAWQSLFIGIPIIIFGFGCCTHLAHKKQRTSAAKRNSQIHTTTHVQPNSVHQGQNQPPQPLSHMGQTYAQPASCQAQQPHCTTSLQPPGGCASAPPEYPGNPPPYQAKPINKKKAVLDVLNKRHWWQD